MGSLTLTRQLRLWTLSRIAAVAEPRRIRSPSPQLPALHRTPLRSTPLLPQSVGHTIPPPPAPPVESLRPRVARPSSAWADSVPRVPHSRRSLIAAWVGSAPPSPPTPRVTLATISLSPSPATHVIERQVDPEGAGAFRPLNPAPKRRSFSPGPLARTNQAARFPHPKIAVNSLKPSKSAQPSPNQTLPQKN
jgi:hypothetical protein